MMLLLDPRLEQNTASNTSVYRLICSPDSAIEENCVWWLPLALLLIPSLHSQSPACDTFLG